MRVKVTGQEQYGVWREGKHDDLVLAVALACRGARKAFRLEVPCFRSCGGRRVGSPTIRCRASVTAIAGSGIV